ncbi:MAG TPA: hypothetical protein VLV78_12220 [Thermoanaerobaculia bacterium]|nr:hypothetical protein [Thermoanaerobaculia bacterium]
MNVDYSALEDKILDGTFRTELEEELTIGFRAMRLAGDPLPLPSYYASQIAEIVNRAAPAPLRAELAYEVYQEILAACESARATVLGEG